MATAVYEIPDAELATVLAEYLGEKGMLPAGYWRIELSVATRNDEKGFNVLVRAEPDAQPVESDEEPRPTPPAHPKPTMTLGQWDDLRAKVGC